MDIDIDVKDREEILKYIKHVPASEHIDDEDEKKHIVGVHVQDIPVDPLTGMSVLDYKQAEERGFFKIDFINNFFLKEIEDPEYMNVLVSMEPDWSLLEKREIVEQLYHIHSYYEELQKFKPRSIEDLAVFLALIRPSKRYLMNKNRKYILKHIWTKEKKGYHFKKSHAFAYALLIICQMNHIKLKKKI